MNRNRFICNWIIRILCGFSQGESLYQKLSRKKIYIEEIEVGKEKFKRVLNVIDLTALGTGSTLGCGVYVLAGTVARSVAGPAVVLSFILAATVSSFSGVDASRLLRKHNIRCKKHF